MTVGAALRQRRYLLSRWPWRAAAYPVSGALVGMCGLAVLLPSFLLGSATAIVLVGLPILVLVGLCGMPIGAVERRRLALVDRRPAPSSHARAPSRRWARRIAFRYQEAATWRELAYAGLLVTVLWPIDAAVVAVALAVPAALLAAPIQQALAAPGSTVHVAKLWAVDSPEQAALIALVGLLILPVCAYVIGAFATARAALTRAALAPPDTEADRRVAQLIRSRADLVDAFEAERRRIERDLHDGAQQRLVALTMSLGLARISGPAESAVLVTRAHHESKVILDELRELVRGVHPKILSDRGLVAALTDAADTSPIAVDLDLDLPGRLPDHVEGTAYFVVRESLTNVAKHSQADSARIHGSVHEGRLVLEIRDDGVGGADSSAGTGLTGLITRVTAVDGILVISSPPGGPTVLRVELPCPTRHRCE